MLVDYGGFGLKPAAACCAGVVVWAIHHTEQLLGLIIGRVVWVHQVEQLASITGTGTSQATGEVAMA